MDKYEKIKQYISSYKYCVDLDINNKKSKIANYTHKNVFLLMQKDKSDFLNNLLSYMNNLDYLSKLKGDDFN